MFAAALLLAGFVGRELWRRRAPEAASTGFPVIEERAAAVPKAYMPPAGQPAGRTETAVSAVPSIKLSRVQRSKSKKVSVPLPK